MGKGVRRDLMGIRSVSILPQGACSRERRLFKRPKASVKELKVGVGIVRHTGLPIIHQKKDCHGLKKRLRNPKKRKKGLTE